MSGLQRSSKGDEGESETTKNFSPSTPLNFIAEKNYRQVKKKSGKKEEGRPRQFVLAAGGELKKKERDGETRRKQMRKREGR